MGDEARIPPPLDGVGGKMNATYLRKIFDQGAQDRLLFETLKPVVQG